MDAGVYAGAPLLAVVFAYGVHTLTETRSADWFGLLMGVLAVWLSLPAAAVFIADLSIHRAAAVAWAAVGLSAVVVGYVVFNQRMTDSIARDTALEELDDPLFIVDAECRLVDYNDAADSVVPRLDADSIGTTVSTVLPQLPEDVASDAPTEVTLTVGTQRRHYSMLVSTITDGDALDGYVILLRDITERKQREQELEATRRELEQSNERLEEFASIVSHDLRNPLNVASLRLEMAREERDSVHLERVAQSHHRMETLIDDVLTLTLEGRESTEIQDVPLAKLVSNCWRTVDTTKATLVVETERVIRADPDRLRQLLENLLRNAVEHGTTSSRPEQGQRVNQTFTRGAARPDVTGGSELPETPGDPEVPETTTDLELPETTTDPEVPETPGDPEVPETTTDLKLPETPGDLERQEVTITVGATTDGFYIADDGPGIPESERDRVLERGYSTAEDGTGLGLAIVQEIAAAHGWEVTVTESADGGAQFEFTDVEVLSPAACRG